MREALHRTAGNEVQRVSNIVPHELTHVIGGGAEEDPFHCIGEDADDSVVKEIQLQHEALDRLPFHKQPRAIQCAAEQRSAARDVSAHQRNKAKVASGERGQAQDKDDRVGGPSVTCPEGGRHGVLCGELRRRIFNRAGELGEAHGEKGFRKAGSWGLTAPQRRSR